MKKSMIAALLVTTLTSTYGLATTSLYACDRYLFNGYSMDKNTLFTICEQDEHVVVTLVDVENDEVIDDIRVPKKNFWLAGEGRIKLLTVMRGEDHKKGGYGYIETNLPSRTLILSSPSGEQVSLSMAEPEYSVLTPFE